MAAAKTTKTPARSRTRTQPPAGAKRPQDHRPASAKADLEQADLAVTYDGHDYTISHDRLDDIELIEVFGRIEDADGNGLAQSIAVLRALAMMLGAEQYEQFKADQKAAHGTCSAEAVGNLFRAIMEASPGN